MPSRPPVFASPGNGRCIGVVGDVYRFLATGTETDGKYAVWEALVPPGGGPPPHVHSREEEAFYILEGELTLTVNGERHVAGPGMFANLPIGSQHSFKNEGTKPVRVLITVTPAGLENMFFEVGAQLPADATSCAPPTESEIHALLAAAPRYGVEILPPPHPATA